MFKIHAVDEAIWHFSGLFHIAEERGRMWIDYDRISVGRSGDPEGEIASLDVVTGYPFPPALMIPDIPYTPPPPPTNSFATEPAYHMSAVSVMPVGLAARSPQITLQAAPAMPVGDGPPHLPPVPEWPEPPQLLLWTMPPPGSVAAVIVQQNVLIDDDRLNADSYTAPLVTSDQIDAKLVQLADQAGELGLPLALERPADEHAFHDMAEAAAAVTAPRASHPDAEVTTLQGDDVLGHYLNGQAVDQRPDIAELMPAYRQPEAEDEADDLSDAEPNAPKTAGASTASGGEIDDNEHVLVTGNNTLINQSVITSAWIAAPVIAVGGDVYSYTLISQTNVWSDSDALIGDILAADAGFQGDPTLSVNYSTYVHYSNPMPDQAQGDGAPQYWVTATVEGSLISANWVEQYNIVSDNEVMSVTLQADQTMMIMGENGAINEVSLTELGTQYDIIIIDGSIINLNAIQQTNVMLDDDRIMVSGPGASVSSGDNLLVNDSTIVQVGQDSTTPAVGGYAQALETAADGTVILPDEVLNDPAFAGQQVVRVLHIEGDLISVNIVSQTNVLGDADQIEVFTQNLLAQGATVDVITGSNVLINSSTIVEIGVDAQIHVAGEVYSDALLHQAELVSTEDPLMAGTVPDLASEAVLFLTDGMIADEFDEAQFVPIGADAATPADAMETVLA